MKVYQFDRAMLDSDIVDMDRFEQLLQAEFDVAGIEAKVCAVKDSHNGAYNGWLREGGEMDGVAVDIELAWTYAAKAYANQ